jgi:plasmid stability protein
MRKLTHDGTTTQHSSWSVILSNLVILDVDDWVIERLSRRAEAHRRPPALEAKVILQEALGQPPAGGCRHANAICEHLADGGEVFDSAELNCENRES